MKIYVIIIKIGGDKMYYGEKVLLRAYKAEDSKLAAEYLNDRELKKLLVTNIPFPTTAWEEDEWVKSQKASNSGEYNFAIEDLETHTYIGGCGIQEINWVSRVATVGIMVGNKEFWGKGYGTDAMKVLVKFIFEEMNINKVKLETFSFNERAIKSYEKCGFKTEGILKEEIFKAGKYYDIVIMSTFNK